MARVASVSFSEEEWKEIEKFLEEKKINTNQLLKQATMQHVQSFSPADRIPVYLQRLIDDLETWKRWKYDRAQNITWLTGRHGVTPTTAEKAVDYFMKDMVL